MSLIPILVAILSFFIGWNIYSYCSKPYRKWLGRQEYNAFVESKKRQAESDE